MTEFIRLQFVRERDFSSQVIAWFSAGHVSHVDTLLDDDQLLGARSDSVGGAPPGVQIRPPDYADFAVRVVMAVPVTVEQKAVYLAFLDDQVGKPYDYKAIWAFLFNRNWRETDSWICSELAAAAAERASIVPPLFLAANKITPVAFALAMSAVNGTVVV